MAPSWRALLADSEASRIAADIDRQGYGVIDNFVSEQEIQSARAVADAAVDAAGGEYVDFKGPDALAGTVLSELPKSYSFQNICRRLYEMEAGKAAPESGFYQLFRCLKGSTGQSNSYRFHYDSYVLTALLPVAIPETGRRGDLLLFRSARPIRRLYLANLLDKLLIESKPAQVLLHLAVARRSRQVVAIKLQPGNMYFFWGYRSIHTNEPSDPDQLRATAVFHYGDPHQNSRIRTLVRRVRAHASRIGAASP